MKARESERAKELFLDESSGRKILERIRTLPHIPSKEHTVIKGFVIPKEKKTCNK